MKEALKNDYNDIKIGAVYSFTHTISEAHVKTFAELSGDFNPLHVNEKFNIKELPKMERFQLYEMATCQNVRF